VQDKGEEISKGGSEGPGVEPGTNISDAKCVTESVADRPSAGWR
jgi:hypothetical protein